MGGNKKKEGNIHRDHQFSVEKNGRLRLDFVSRSVHIHFFFLIKYGGKINGGILDERENKFCFLLHLLSPCVWYARFSNRHTVLVRGGNLCGPFANVDLLEGDLEILLLGDLPGDLVEIEGVHPSLNVQSTVGACAVATADI